MGKNSGMYRFVVDCHPDHCKEVQDYMSENSFTVKKVDDTWLGDHEGTRQFKSDEAATAEAKRLAKKYDDKVYQITVLQP